MFCKSPAMVLLSSFGLASIGLAVLAPASAQEGADPTAGRVAEEIVALERAALDRWTRADPQGYLDLYAAEITYFDPTVERRVDGLEAMRGTLATLEEALRPFEALRYDMIAPKVQLHGDVAVLSFNLIVYARPTGGPESELVRWNATKVYRRGADEPWSIIHSHWSYLRPAPPASPRD